MKVKAIHPKLDYVLVKPVAKEQKSAGGLYMPEGKASNDPQKAIVLGVGPGRMGELGKMIEVRVRVGSTVLVHGLGGGAPVDLADGSKGYIIRDENILAEIDEIAE